MAQRPPFRALVAALDECGMETPPQCEDWLHVGVFHATINDRADLLSLQHFMNHMFGKGSFALIPESDDMDRVISVHFAIPRVPQIWDWVKEQIDLIMNGERICDEIFDDLVEKEIKRLWQEATIPQRLDWVEEAGIDADAVLRSEIDVDLHVVLYRVVTDD